MVSPSELVEAQLQKLVINAIINSVRRFRLLEWRVLP